MLRRIPLLLGVVVLAACALVGAFTIGTSAITAWRGHESPSQRAGQPRRVDPVAADVVPAATATKAPKPKAIVAESRVRSLAVFAHRGASHPARRLERRKGHRLVLLVLRQRRAWLEVALPVRPNGSRGWIRRRDVALAGDDLSLVIDLRRHRLVVRDGSNVLRRIRIGVGQAVTPTPPGRYFLTELIRSVHPKGLYGPYAFGTSAYSKVLTSFNGGNGQIGIHGTDDPPGLGRDVSHGCIRMSNRDIKYLARLLPLGTPVVILPDKSRASSTRSGHSASTTASRSAGSSSSRYRSATGATGSGSASTPTSRSHSSSPTTTRPHASYRQGSGSGSSGGTGASRGR